MSRSGYDLDADVAHGLLDALRRALPRVDHLVGSSTAAAAGELMEIVRDLIERLREAADRIGLEHREAWRILSVREALASRELAAALLWSTEAQVEIVLGHLGQGVHDTYAALVFDNN